MLFYPQVLHVVSIQSRSDELRASSSSPPSIIHCMLTFVRPSPAPEESSTHFAFAVHGPLPTTGEDCTKQEAVDEGSFVAEPSPEILAEARPRVFLLHEFSRWQELGPFASGSTPPVATWRKGKGSAILEGVSTRVPFLGSGSPKETRRTPPVWPVPMYLETNP